MAFNPLPELPQPVHLSKMGRDFKQPGVYFLWHLGAVVYVGQSRDVYQRILDHAVNRLKTFDGISFLPCRVPALLSRERFYISALLPKYNRCSRSERIRRTWEGHMDERPMRDRNVSANIAASVLGVTVEQLQKLHRYGLPHRRIRIPRKNARRIIYSVRDLHQFTAQRAEAILAVKRIDAA